MEANDTEAQWSVSMAGRPSRDGVELAGGVCLGYPPMMLRRKEGGMEGRPRGRGQVTSRRSSVGRVGCTGGKSVQ